MEIERKKNYFEKSFIFFLANYFASSVQRADTNEK